MAPEREAVILFMRAPELGKVKTRLAESVGAVEALRVYKMLIRRTLGVLTDVKRACPGASVFVFFTPEGAGPELRRRYPGPWKFVPQEGGHLGDRMRRALERALSLGACRAVLVGSDVAGLTAGDIVAGLDALRSVDAVLGPASDGGFYLIGLRRRCSAPFKPEEWGGSGVSRRTMELLSRSGFSVRRLTERADIDRGEDLKLLDGDVFCRAKISVIVPTLGEKGDLQPLLGVLDRELWPGDDVTVVQGRTNGAGQERPETIGENVRWMFAPVGRGVQMDWGAREAGGDILWFLHDDCLPPPNLGHGIRRIVASPSLAVGCFRLAFQPSTPLLDAIAAWANWRSRWLKLPYGDQGFFCSREVYEKVGGFGGRLIMEDVVFLRAARKFGAVLRLDDVLLTSSRRHLKRGVLRASMENHYAMLLHSLGADDRRIYSHYYRDGADKDIRKP